MTEQWLFLEFPDPFNVPTRTLHDAFLAQCIARGGKPGSTAVFSIHDLRTNKVIWYFSPDAAALGEIFGAIACDKPEPIPRLGLLVGDSTSWQTHFPGFTPSIR